MLTELIFWAEQIVLFKFDESFRAKLKLKEEDISLWLAEWSIWFAASFLTWNKLINI